VKIKQLTKELAAAREALHRQHDHHDLMDLDLGGEDTPSVSEKDTGVASSPSKELSHNFPVSGEILELKDTRVMAVRLNLLMKTAFNKDLWLCHLRDQWT
jgi:hypothetical protein